MTLYRTNTKLPKELYTLSQMLKMRDESERFFCLPTAVLTYIKDSYANRKSCLSCEVFFIIIIIFGDGDETKNAM